MKVIKISLGLMAGVMLLSPALFCSAPTVREDISAFYLKKPLESWRNYVQRLGVKVTLYTHNHPRAVSDFEGSFKTGIDDVVIDVKDPANAANFYYPWCDWGEGLSQAMYAMLTTVEGLKGRVLPPMNLYTGLIQLQNEEKTSRIYLPDPVRGWAAEHREAFKEVFGFNPAGSKFLAAEESFLAQIASFFDGVEPSLIRSINIEREEGSINTRKFGKAIRNKVVQSARACMDEYFAKTMMSLPLARGSSLRGKHVFLLLLHKSEINEVCRFLFDYYARCYTDKDGTIDFEAIKSFFQHIEIIGLSFAPTAVLRDTSVESTDFLEEKDEPPVVSFDKAQLCERYGLLAARYAKMLGLAASAVTAAGGSGTPVAPSALRI